MDRIRPSNNQPGPQQQNSSPDQSGPSGRLHQVSLSSKLLVVGIVLVGIAIAAALSVGAFGNNNGGVKKDQYQAVFLDNGQVYFGNLDNINSPYVTLTDIYYLQVQQDAIQEGENSAAADPQISLAKLGNELHGPEDVMYISRDKILFWENMKDDSDVVEAIKNDNSQQDSANDNSSSLPADTTNGSDAADDTQNSVDTTP